MSAVAPLIELVSALDQFLEAAKRVNREKAKYPLISKLEKDMARAFTLQAKAFLRELEKVKDQFPVPLPEVEETAMPLPNWEPGFDAAILRTIKAFEVPLSLAIERSIVAGAAAFIAEIKLPISFSLKNPRAVKYLATVGAKRITQVHEETKDIIRHIVTAGVEEGQSYDTIAKEITTRFHEFAVGKPQKHIASRAHLVAITEVGDAYSEGNMIVARDVAELGIEMEKHWLDSGDNLVSDGCLDNSAAGWIPIDEPFPSGHDRPLRFPGCRCDIEFRRKPEVSAGG